MKLLDEAKIYPRSGDGGAFGEPAVVAPVPYLRFTIFVAAMATLMAQILVTRLFSALMFYHYAFAAISLTMLGMTIGALLVFLRPAFFTPEKYGERIAQALSGFALGIAYSVLLQAALPLFSSVSVAAVIANLVVYLPAFVCSGVVVTLILTRAPREQVGGIYAADLCGAALGCLLVLGLLEWLGAINAMLFVAASLMLMAWRLAASVSALSLSASLGRIALGLALLLIANIGLEQAGWRHFSMQYQRGKNTGQYTQWEAWNSYSHVNVSTPVIETGASASISPRYDYPVLPHRLVEIDAGASTDMVEFKGDFVPISYLRHDLFSSAYHLRPVESVAVIGVGAGRDILSAKAHGAGRVLGMEMNRSILRALTGEFGDFSGHLDRLPGVWLVNAEARSYLTQQEAYFDLIQISMIDTWAATAAGAFALTENGLYTQEAWRGFFERLSPRGMMSFSRWYDPQMRRGEVYRMLSLARAMLGREGIASLREHIVVVTTSNVATLIISKPPITAAEMDALTRYETDNGFNVLLSPQTVADPVIADLLGTDTAYRRASADLPLDISPPTDDRPFFFNMLGFFQALPYILHAPLEHNLDLNVRAVEVLLLILLLVTVLCAAFIFLPLMRFSRGSLRPPYASMLYFTLIGVGFMFLEMAQMSRLMIYLGHPAYALAVVLFSLLLASGMGSLSTGCMPGGRWRFIALCAVLVATGIAAPPLISATRAAADGVRIVIATTLMLPMGFFMGMPFPLGLKRLGVHNGVDIAPWLWGVNGASSVFASVVGLCVVLFSGIVAAFEVGIGCYFGAAILYFYLTRAEKKVSVAT